LQGILAAQHLFTSNSEWQGTMKQLLVICASILCIILGINLSIDPAHLHKPGSGQSDEARIASILLADQQAVVPRERIGFDERISRQMLLEQRAKTDRSVIFGSSRVRYFSTKAFDDELHFVDAVNAATLEDLLVFSYLRVLRSKQLPKNLYVALDPWMIEQANSYTRLVQLSYPDAFVQAVEHFGFGLPEGSAKVYKNLAGNRKNLLRVPIVDVIAGGVVAGNYQAVAIGKLPIAGPLQISFDGWITEGTYYWAWRVLLNGVPVDEGNYMDNLQGSPAPHQPRTFVTKQLEAKVGDAITVEMVHADGRGVAVSVGTQQYKAESFSVQVKCDSPAAIHYKNSFNCNDILEPSRYLRYIPIVKEMLSPAYLQQSLKVLLQAKRGSAAPNIEAKPLCLPDANQANYIFCSDGSVPWPLVENYDSGKVENIVRTIDDGLVPLKSIDGNALELLKQLTDFYVRNGTAVTYVLVPVHPFSYEKWKSENDSRGFLLAETTYRKFASTNGIPIVGSYNPTVVGCKNTDFRDWVHPLPRCTNLIASALKRVTPSLASHN
jgi:hypothetical protein